MPFLGHGSTFEAKPHRRAFPDDRQVQCRVAFKSGHPQFVWCRGSILALSKFGPARPYIARFKVFNRLIWPSA